MNLVMNLVLLFSFIVLIKVCYVIYTANYKCINSESEELIYYEKSSKSLYNYNLNMDILTIVKTTEIREIGNEKYDDFFENTEILEYLEDEIEEKKSLDSLEKIKKTNEKLDETGDKGEYGNIFNNLENRNEVPDYLTDEEENLYDEIKNSNEYDDVSDNIEQSDKKFDYTADKKEGSVRNGFITEEKSEKKNKSKEKNTSTESILDGKENNANLKKKEDLVILKRSVNINKYDQILNGSNEIIEYSTGEEEKLQANECVIDEKDEKKNKSDAANVLNKSVFNKKDENTIPKQKKENTAFDDLKKNYEIKDSNRYYETFNNVEKKLEEKNKLNEKNGKEQIIGKEFKRNNEQNYETVSKKSTKGSEINNKNHEEQRETVTLENLKKADKIKEAEDSDTSSDSAFESNNELEYLMDEEELEDEAQVTKEKFDEKNETDDKNALAKLSDKKINDINREKRETIITPENLKKNNEVKRPNKRNESNMETERIDRKLDKEETFDNNGLTVKEESIQKNELNQANVFKKSTTDETNTNTNLIKKGVTTRKDLKNANKKVKQLDKKTKVNITSIPNKNNIDTKEETTTNKSIPMKINSIVEKPIIKSVNQNGHDAKQKLLKNIIQPTVTPLHVKNKKSETETLKKLILMYSKIYSNPFNLYRKNINSLFKLLKIYIERLSCDNPLTLVLEEILTLIDILHIFKLPPLIWCNVILNPLLKQIFFTRNNVT